MLFWNGQELPLQHVFGPERLAFEWWTARRASSAGRDYYRVQTAAGGWLWLFRARECGAWFLHGEWA